MSVRTERIIVTLAFLAAGVSLALAGIETLAASAIGAAAGYAVPRMPPAAPAGLAILAVAATVMVGG